MAILPAGPYYRMAFHGNDLVLNPDHLCFMAIDKFTFSEKHGPKNLLSSLRITRQQEM